MINDGKCYLWIPSALTLNRLTAETAAIINAVHTALSLPTVSVGQTNPYYLDMNDLDMGGAPFTRDAVPGLAVCGPIENMSYMTVPYVNLIVAFGTVASQMLGIAAGDVEGLPVWFELDTLDGEVPETFPERTYQEGGQTLVHTWETWGVFGESHKPVQLGGKWYRSANYGQSGDFLLASQWVNRVSSVKTKAEFLAIQAANAPSFP